MTGISFLPIQEFNVDVISKFSAFGVIGFPIQEFLIVVTAAIAAIYLLNLALGKIVGHGEDSVARIGHVVIVCLKLYSPTIGILFYIGIYLKALFLAIGIVNVDSFGVYGTIVIQ